MNLRHPFDKSRSLTVQDMLGIPASTRKDHLVVSTIDIQDMVKLAAYGATAVHVVPLKKSEGAQGLLNGVARWIRESGALDQRNIHADQREEYGVSFYRIMAGSPYPALLSHFVLEEHLFPDRSPSDVWRFEDLMRMLDRDRLGGAMLKALIEDFEIPLKKNAAAWADDLRAASHPDCRPVAPACPNARPAHTFA